MADKKLNDFDQPIKLTDRELKQLIPGYLTVYREMGMRALRSDNAEEALRKFHAAAAAYPDDVRNLLGRGQSRYRIQLLKEAQADAEKVLETNDYNKEAILLKARCEYELGNAEEALLMFRRGANKRGMRREFKEGGQAVVATLENCVGRHSGPALLNFQPTIHAMIEKQRQAAKMEGEKKKTQCLEDTKPFYTCSDEEWNRLQLKWQIRDKRIAFVYLGNIAEELEFCRNLSDHADPRIRTIAQQCFRETEDLLAILRDRRPLYHIRYKYKSCGKIIAKQKADLLENELKRLSEHTERMLRNLEKFRCKSLFKNCVSQAHRLKLLLNTFPEPAAELKSFYLNVLSNSMADVYFQLKQLHPKLTKKDSNIRTVFSHISFDWITDSSTFPFFDCKSWIKTYQGFIDISENDLERAWLHYELSRAYIIAKKWPHVTAEARKAAKYAQNCEHLVWQANALVLDMIAETRRIDGEALKVFEQCFDVALKIGNENFLKCLEEARAVLNDRTKEKPYDVEAANAKREDEIIRLMDGEEGKGRASDLFSRMRFLRADRRMSLVTPGIVPSKKRGGTLSIIPGGSGGRLGLHAVKNQTYYEFLGVPDPFK